MMNSNPTETAVDQDTFSRLEETLRSGGPEATFDLLIRNYRDEKNYWLVFEASLMKKRHELGLPLIWAHSLNEVPDDSQKAYEAAYIETAREVGGLFLNDGDIVNAWPYFRAIGDTRPVYEAVDRLNPREQEEVDPIIDIAFQEGVHPRKGIELILEHYGLCRAITNFSQYPGQAGRDECIRLLLDKLYAELLESLKLTVARREGSQPETNSISALIRNRDWLFEGNSYYVDTSHLASVIRFSLELDEPEVLSKAVELSEYGKHLSTMFQPREHPPFEKGYEDYHVYLRALLGENVEGAVSCFRHKVAEHDPEQYGSYPAQILVELLARVDRFEEAIDVYLQYLQTVKPNELHCPSVAQLCQLAGDHQRLMKIARETSDPLTYTAGLLQSQSR